MKYRIIIFSIFIATSLQGQRPALDAWYEHKIQDEVQAVTEVMFHDVVNPPAAARFYAYVMLAGYETLCFEDSLQPAFQHSFRNYPKIDFDNKLRVDIRFACLYSMLQAAILILPSGYLLNDKLKQLSKEYQELRPSRQLAANSSALGYKVARTIIEYCRSDGYFALSTKQRYTPLAGEDHWKPTPPEYMSAVEPHWKTIRPFFLDSAQQCKPLPCEHYDTLNSSTFYKLVKEVYETGNHLSDEQKLIANFWDCNPFAVQFQGHMSVGLKKISPGGHWMGITGAVCRQQHLTFGKTLLLHTLVACTLHDAFISCWDEKYRSNRIRPETAINKMIDEKWKPMLQTPPFPEYTSGHSVISTAAAEVLTHFMGDNIAFTDSTETYIGLPPRKFTSFRKAAAEACISRLYGGIHYRDAIENGQEQGKRIAEWIISRLNHK